jgi:hypothetical protein
MQSGRSSSRRAFLQGGLGLAVAAGVAPLALGRSEKSKPTTRPVIVGKDQHTYEVIDDWAKLPKGKQFGNTHGVCETADGRIFIHNASPTGDSVCEFDADGDFIRSWGQQFAAGAHGMQLRKEGAEEFLYLAPTGLHRVFKTTLKGDILLDLAYPKDATNAARQRCYPDESKYVPTNIAFAPGDNGGDFYVADGYGSNYIHHYTAIGEYVRTWGGAGSAPGQLKCPHGIWCDTRDREHPKLVVADRANVRLQYFSLDGAFLSVVTDELRHPCHFDQREDELLIPDLKGRVTIFDKDNKLVVHLGDNPVEKWRANNGVPQDQLLPGQFCSPHQAIWDRAGNIYVVEWLKYGRVTKLRHVA